MNVTLAAVAAVATLGGAALAVRAVRDRARFRRLGYRARLAGRDAVSYEERTTSGDLRRLVLDGGLMGSGPHVMYPPDETRWNLEMPAWAHGRRREILEKIVHYFGPGRMEIDALD